MLWQEEGKISNVLLNGILGVISSDPLFVKWLSDSQKYPFNF